MQQDYGWRGPSALRRKKDRLRLHLFEIQRGICCLCCKPMTLDHGKGKTPPKNFASFEHVQPRAKGGKNRRNIVLTCRRCNTARGHRPLTFDEVMRVEHVLLLHRQQLAARLPEQQPAVSGGVVARNSAGSA